MTIHTLYPTWFVVFCLLTGAVYATIMYHKSVFFKNKSIFSFPLAGLIVARFITVSLLSFFLLSPFVKKLFKKTEKPVIVIAADNSASLLLNRDSILYKEKFENTINEVSKQLEKKYNVINYTFGNKVSEGANIDFSEQRTNFSDLFNQVYEQTYNKNLGALIIFSDGIFNQGNDPFLDATDIICPLYTVAMGDTVPPRDLIVKDVVHNSIAFLGNKIPLQIDIEAFKLKNEIAILKVELDNQRIYSETINVESNNLYLSRNILIEAKKAGLQKFTISLNPIDKEISLKNNSKDIFIEVLDEKKKVIIIANSPHPDIASIKMALKEAENYTVNSYFIIDIEKNPALIEKEISTGIVLILHQLPSEAQAASRLINVIDKNQLPVLYILGSQTSVAALNKLNCGLQISQTRKNVESSLPSLNNEFNFFSIENNINQVITEFPPLTTPFGNYKLNTANQILFYQKIGSVNTTYPLFVLLQQANKRSGIISGEGIWRWRMSEFRKNSNNLVFNEIIQKTIQYLSVKSDRRYFRITSNRFEFFDDEQIFINAELLNKNLEKKSNADIKLRIINPANKLTIYNFYETAEGYKSSVGFLSPGKYLFSAETVIDGKTEKLSGIFIVKKTDLEYKNTVANHQLLFQLAKTYNGKMYQFNEAVEIADEIKSNEQIRPKIIFNTETNDLIELKFFFFIIIFLLAFEWFIRKFFGSY